MQFHDSALDNALLNMITLQSHASSSQYVLFFTNTANLSRQKGVDFVYFRLVRCASFVARATMLLMSRDDNATSETRKSWETRPVDATKPFDHA